MWWSKNAHFLAPELNDIYTANTTNELTTNNYDTERSIDRNEEFISLTSKRLLENDKKYKLKKSI